MDNKNNSNKANQGQKNEMNIMDMVNLCLSRWYWFVISVVVCLIIGVIMLKCTVPTYSNSAQILIKDSKRARGLANDLASSMADMGMYASSTNVHNEIVAIASPVIMQEVVRSLHLDVSYHGSGFWYNPVLYGKNLPFNVTFLDLAENEGASMEVNMNKEGGFVLSKFKKSGVELDGEVEGVLNDTLSTPVGKVLLNQGEGYLAWASDIIEDNSTNLHFYVSKGSVEKIAKAYSRRVSISLNNKENSVIDIKIVDQSVQRAQEVLETLIAVYNNAWVADKNLIAVSTSGFINNRLTVIEKDLGIVDNSISEFKGANRIPDLKAAAQLYMQRSEVTTNELLKLNTTLSIAQYLFDFMSDMATDDVLPAINGLENANIESQISEYNNRVITRERLVASSSETNTLVVDYTKAISALRDAILSSLNNYMISLKSQIKTLEKRERGTNSQLASSPYKAKELLSIERQQKVKEALYLFLLQKREENELTQTFTAYNNRIITAPHDEGLVAPVSSKYLLLAILLGLAFPAGFLIAREMLDTKVRIKSDLDSINVPFAGEIPQMYDTMDKKWWEIWKSVDKIVARKALMAVQEGKRDYLNESFRVLRSNLEFMTERGKKGTTFLLTSFNPGSGKSFLSMNIAMVFAIRHNNVLVIDCDLRHGSTSEYVNSPKKGLSSILSGKIEDYNDALVNYEGNKHLFVLPIGIIPPNPSELLYSPKFKEIMDDAKKKYDYIILDCPPVNMLADTQILNPYADRSLFVVRSGLMDLKQLDEVNEISDKLNNMAIILNASKSGGSTYGGRYGYRYGYGYHYGYGKKEDYYSSFADTDTK